MVAGHIARGAHAWAAAVKARATQPHNWLEINIMLYVVHIGVRLAFGVGSSHAHTSGACMMV